MNSKIYVCGWCGHPTDNNGNCLNGDCFDRAMKILNSYTLGNHLELTYGECCPNGNVTHEDNYVQITRDMAIDACDRSLEGQWIKW